MRLRKILPVVFGMLLGSVALYVLLLPRLRNEISCHSSVPFNAAQTTALADARARKAAVCAASAHQCIFNIYELPDGHFRIGLYFADTTLFEGCVVERSDREELLYDAEGE